MFVDRHVLRSADRALRLHAAERRGAGRQVGRRHVVGQGHARRVARQSAGRALREHVRREEARPAAATASAAGVERGRRRRPRRGRRRHRRRRPFPMPSGPTPPTPSVPFGSAACGLRPGPAAGGAAARGASRQAGVTAGAARAGDAAAPPPDAAPATGSPRRCRRARCRADAARRDVRDRPRRATFGLAAYPVPPSATKSARSATSMLGRGRLIVYSGMLPCLRCGCATRLVCSVSSARDQLRARLVRDDHVVDVAALGRRVRVGEARLVVGDQLLRGARPASASVARSLR